MDEAGTDRALAGETAAHALVSAPLRAGVDAGPRSRRVLPGPWPARVGRRAGGVATRCDVVGSPGSITDIVREAGSRCVPAVIFTWTASTRPTMTGSVPDSACCASALPTVGPCLSPADIDCQRDQASSVCVRTKSSRPLTAAPATQVTPTAAYPVAGTDGESARTPSRSRADSWLATPGSTPVSGTCSTAAVRAAPSPAPEGSADGARTAAPVSAQAACGFSRSPVARTQGGERGSCQDAAARQRERVRGHDSASSSGRTSHTTVVKPGTQMRIRPTRMSHQPVSNRRPTATSMTPPSRLNHI